MRTLIIMLVVALPGLARGAACCLGGGPKSFLSFQALESYELGIASGVRDVYGWFTPGGELEETEKNRTYTVAVAAGKRLIDDLYVFTTLPLVYQENGTARGGSTRASLGDVVLGGQYTVLRSLFQDDPYPTVNLSAGVKAPTGSQETWMAGKFLPGTGNGFWEPFLGASAQKSLGPFRLLGSVTFTARLPRDVRDEGDRIDLSESLAYVVTQRLSLAVGSNQFWVTPTRLRGATLVDSAGRALEVFASPMYFFERTLSATLVATVTLPVEGWSMNQQAMRYVGVMTRYGFY